MHGSMHLSSMSIDPWMDHSEKRVKIPYLYHAYMVKLMKRKLGSKLHGVHLLLLPSFLNFLPSFFFFFFFLYFFFFCVWDCSQNTILGFNKKGHLLVGISFLYIAINKLTTFPNLLPSQLPHALPPQNPAPPNHLQLKK